MSSSDPPEIKINIDSLLKEIIKEPSDSKREFLLKTLQIYQSNEPKTLLSIYSNLITIYKDKKRCYLLLKISLNTVQLFNDNFEKLSGNDGRKILTILLNSSKILKDENYNNLFCLFLLFNLEKINNYYANEIPDEDYEKIKKYIKINYDTIVDELNLELNIIKNENFNIFNEDLTAFDNDKKEKLFKTIDDLIEMNNHIIENNLDINKINVENNKYFFIISKNWFYLYNNLIKYLKKKENKFSKCLKFYKDGFEISFIFEIFHHNLNNKLQFGMNKDLKINKFVGPINNLNLVNINIDYLQELNNELSFTNVYLNNCKEYYILDEQQWINISKFFSCINEIQRKKVENDYEISLRTFKIYILDQNNALCDKSIQASQYESMDNLLNRIQNIINNNNNKEELKLDLSNANIHYIRNIVNDKNNLNFILFNLLLSYSINIDSFNLDCDLLNPDDKIKPINTLFKTDEEIILLISITNFINKKTNQCIICGKTMDNDKIIKCQIFNNCPNSPNYCSVECFSKDMNHKKYHNIMNNFIIKKVEINDLVNMDINQLIKNKESNHGLNGLHNIGNTCFMNSALQCLSNCEDLTKLFLSKKYRNEINYVNKNGTKGEIANAYYKLIKHLYNDNKALHPSDFRQTFIQFARQFSGFSQQDSNEFLIFILDKLHEDLNRINKKPYIEMKSQEDNETDQQASSRFWKNFLMRDDSLIVDLFYGQFKSKITCPDCNKISITYEPFMFLSLPIPTFKLSLKLKYFPLSSITPLIFDIFINKNITVDELKNKLICELQVKSKNNHKLIKKNISLVLFTHKDTSNIKIINKIFNENDYLYQFISNKNNELCAYEKNEHKEDNNIYCYLCNYDINYYFFNSIPYENISYLSAYPISLSLNEKDNIDEIYRKIKVNILQNNEIKLVDKNSSKLEETKSLMNSYSSITKEAEDKTMLFKLHLHNSNYRQKFCDFCGLSVNNYNINNSSHTCRLLNRFKNNENYKYIKSCMEKKSYPLVLNIEIYNKQINIVNRENVVYSKTSPLNIINKNINLTDCLNLFISEEKLEKENAWYCNQCKEHKEAFKKMDLYKSPYYLIIQLKRFKRNDDMNSSSFFSVFHSVGNKNDTFIDFPINDLDLSKFTLSNDGNQENNLYDLFAVCQHYGGINFGHYTAVCKNYGKWYKFNDSSVYPVGNEDEIINEAAYILFYKKKNAK